MGNALKNNNRGMEQMGGGWKIEYMDFVKNNLGRLTNDILSIKSKVKEIKQ